MYSVVSCVEFLLQCYSVTIVSVADIFNFEQYLLHILQLYVALTGYFVKAMHVTRTFHLRQKILSQRCMSVKGNEGSAPAHGLET